MFSSYYCVIIKLSVIICLVTNITSVPEHERDDCIAQIKATFKNRKNGHHCIQYAIISLTKNMNCVSGYKHAKGYYDYLETLLERGQIEDPHNFNGWSASDVPIPPPPAPQVPRVRENIFGKTAEDAIKNAYENIVVTEKDSATFKYAYVHHIAASYGLSDTPPSPTEYCDGDY